MTVELQDRRPALPYAQRFVWGTVVNVEHHVLHIRLETQNYDLPTNLMPQRARIRKENWPLVEAGCEQKCGVLICIIQGWLKLPGA